MADAQLPFAFDAPDGPPPEVLPEALVRDADARLYAVDPSVNVALEASAGTGKTKVLVDRYVNLLRLGVEPRRVLALTFTRKAAAEMRARIVAELTRMAEIGSLPSEIWQELRGRLSEIAISTIDAFCLSLLGEFPLESDVDPGFGVADETETPRLVDEALDRALRIGRAQCAHDPDLALLFARMGEGRLRVALAKLLDRRLVAVAALDRFLSRAPRDLSAEGAAARIVARLRALWGPDQLARLRATGPDVNTFRLLSAALTDAFEAGASADPGQVADLLARLREYFCTQGGTPRKKPLHLKATFPSGPAYTAHAALLDELGGGVLDLVHAHQRDVNVVLARSLRWLTARAIEQYRTTLDEHVMVDFTDALLKALALLAQMEEFSQSRYRLESRYQHVLVDELQDTSRPQWQLVELLVQAWGAGAGVSHDGPTPPSIFVVGDRKQSIYGFRDADVGVLDAAARLIGRLRPGREPRRAIVKSFRAVPALQRFVNDVCDEIDKRSDRVDAFRYSDLDRFPVPGDDTRARPVGLVAAAQTSIVAQAVAGEIARLLAAQEAVRDRHTGIARDVQPGDIAILFRSRDSHRAFERELEQVGVPFYVYKGLGFFDADEVKDVIALIHYLAEPDTDRQAAAFLRSRFVRLSDPALTALAPRLARALRSPEPPAEMAALSDDDRTVFAQARQSVADWIARTDRLPPAELIDGVLHESAYYYEIRGRGQAQARENLKKLRSLIRRLQNRGYATLGRVAERVSQLMAGDESNATVDALDAVNLMTVHAAKGLEFPVVFVVNLSRGAGGRGGGVEVVTRVEADGSVEDLVSLDGLADEVGDEIEAREREESKRLMYVALTRARDRLYLATTLAKNGTFAPGPASLGHVLPPSFAPAFAQAAGAGAGTEAIAWVAASGARHELRVVSVATAPIAAVVAPAPSRGDDFAPLVVARTGASNVSDLARLAAPAMGSSAAGDRAAARALGALVHRAVAAGALEAADDERLAIVARLGAGVAPALCDQALDALTRLAQRDDIRLLMGEADVLHEVPLSWTREDGTTVRAVLDAVVCHQDGRFTVVEFKTGRTQEADERQLADYLTGLGRLLGGKIVSGRIIRLNS
jgi:ATP-dependent helicase/nuclease subunit A